MALANERTGASRHGKHSPEAFRVALYLTAEEKAMAVLVAELSGKTLSDVLRAGLAGEAVRAGVMENGSVAEAFRTRLEAYKKVLVAEMDRRRGVAK